MGAGGEEGRKEDSASDNHGRPGKETKEGHGKQERGRGGGSPPRRRDPRGEVGVGVRRSKWGHKRTQSSDSLSEL